MKQIEKFKYLIQNYEEKSRQDERVILSKNDNLKRLEENNRQLMEDIKDQISLN